jgi:hypothetical protein
MSVAIKDLHAALAKAAAELAQWNENGICVFNPDTDFLDLQRVVARLMDITAATRSVVDDVGLMLRAEEDDAPEDMTAIRLGTVGQMLRVATAQFDGAQLGFEYVRSGLAEIKATQNVRGD